MAKRRRCGGHRGVRQTRPTELPVDARCWPRGTGSAPLKSAVVWCVPSQEWNCRYHAERGDGAATECAFPKFGNDEEDFEHLGEIEGDEMLEFDVVVDGHPRTMPMVVLWRSDDDGRVSRCRPGPSVVVLISRCGR